MKKIVPCPVADRLIRISCAVTSIAETIEKRGGDALAKSLRDAAKLLEDVALSEGKRQPPT